MAFRTATAHWEGSVRDGNGQLALGSGAFSGPYSFKSRTEETAQTNPEELIGAAHAGCFTMALAAQLSQAGHPPTRLDTTATVHLTRDDIGLVINQIDLVTEGVVPDLDEATFQQLATQAKQTCPISRALTGVATITLQAKLLAG